MRRAIDIVLEYVCVLRYYDGGPGRPKYSIHTGKQVKQLEIKQGFRRRSRHFRVDSVAGKRTVGIGRCRLSALRLIFEYNGGYEVK